MGKGILIEKGGDLVGLAREILLSGGEDLSRSLVAFPGIRPGHFLRRALAEALKRPYIPPDIISMDNWVEEICRRSGETRPLAGDVDAVGLLYHLVETSGLPGGPGGKMSLEDFLPWGWKLFSDFEELALEGIKPEALTKFEVLIGAGLPPRMEGALSSLGSLYERFYEKLEEEGLTTRSGMYRMAAGEEPDLSGLDRVLLVGFFALSGAEETLFKKFLASEKTLLLVQDGPGIDVLIKGLGVRYERKEGRRKPPEVRYWKAPDVHGEVMRLTRELGKDADSRTAVVLPSPGALFPVLQSTLAGLEGEWNVSMGYPLVRTPVWSLLATLGRVLESREEADGGMLYFVPDYLRLLLHPYIKNLYWGKASWPTRVLLHTVEETLNERGERFLRLEDIEKDGKLQKEAFERLSGAEVDDLSPRAVSGRLQEIHGLLLRPFQDLLEVGQFADRLLALVSHLSQGSPAHQHPYAGDFFASLIEALHELKSSRLAGERFREIRGYFQLLETLLQGRNVPFRGTPLRGLQVLGSLEIRNLCFERVFYLDANEGILPPTGKLETLLPNLVRKEFGMATHERGEAIARYYFENLVAGAGEAHLFYVESEEQEKSRFVERLLWEEQKGKGALDSLKQGVIFFDSQFAQKDPLPVPKSREVLDRLRAMTFSSSRLDAYLSCPMKFYYRKVLHLEERGGMSEDLEATEIGTLVHGILNEFFKDKLNKPLTITKADYAKALGMAERIFRETYGSRIEGNLYLVLKQVKTRIGDILDFHRDHYLGTVIQECEKYLDGGLEVPGIGTVLMEGWLDRIDRRSRETVVVDYKTGSTGNKPSSKFALDERAEWHKTLGSVQLPLYLILYQARHPESRPGSLNSSLLFLKSRPIEEKFLFKEDVDRNVLLGQYREAVLRLIQEILDPKTPFGDTLDPEQTCVNCGYKVMCGRQWVVRRW